ncbi:SO_0444 family Cu/Zn efflux transporter [bacterium]|nr:SO_0444 family Cu/Zn efflux transporter [candidate division CSSED10-310 bacterium]
MTTARIILAATNFLKRFIIEFWLVFAEMAPYLLLGFFIAGVLSVVISPKFIQRHLGGRSVWSAIKATLLGVPLPLCSCGVIPVSASLRYQGASKSATTAFLLSTPQTGVDSILVTYSLLGPLFAVFRPLAAMITGLIGGVAVSFLKDSGDDSQQTSAEPNQIPNTNSSSKSLVEKFNDAMRFGFLDLPKDISKSLIVGLGIAGFLSALVIPREMFSAVLGGGISAMFIMMILGIPVYVCATASVPIAAVLIMKGVSPGAALVFLLTGPATNAATISTIWKIMGRNVVVIYLATVAITALASGLLVDAFFPGEFIPKLGAQADMGVEIIKHGSAVILLAILLYGAFKRTPTCCDGSCSSKH